MSDSIGSFKERQDKRLACMETQVAVQSSPIKQAELYEERDRIDKLIVNLSTRVSDLNDKLFPFMRPAISTTDCDNKACDVESSQHIMWMRDIGFRIIQITDLLSEFNERLVS